MNEKIFKIFQYCKENNIEYKYKDGYMDGCRVMDLIISFKYNKDYINYFNELNIFNNISINSTFGGSSTKFVTMSYMELYSEDELKEFVDMLRDNINNKLKDGYVIDMIKNNKSFSITYEDKRGILEDWKKKLKLRRREQNLNSLGI